MNGEDEFFETAAQRAGLALRSRAYAVAGDLPVLAAAPLLRRRRITGFAAGIAALGAASAVVAGTVAIYGDVPASTPEVGSTAAAAPSGSAQMTDATAAFSWLRVVDAGEVFGAPRAAGSMHAVTVADGQFVAVGIASASSSSGVGRPGVWRSLDGQMWTRVPGARIDDADDTDSAFLMNGVAALPGGPIVAVGYRNDEPANAPVAWRSSDRGASWQLAEPLPVPAGRSGALNAVAVADGDFIAVGSVSDVEVDGGPAPTRREEAAAWRSSDGMHWESVPLPLASPSSLQSVAFGDGTAVAVGISGQRPLIVQSTRGQPWRAVDSGLAGGDFTSVAFGRYGFLAVGSTRSGDGFVMGSPSGDSWSQAGDVRGLTGYLSTVYFTPAGAPLIGGTDTDGRAVIWSRDNPEWVPTELDLAGRPDGGVGGFAELDGRLIAVGHFEGAVPHAAVWRASPVTR
ncbi:MAG: hypothetical protein ABIM89_17765 [Mycobacteriales bacterium]